jgi:hypothetical protein
LQFLGTRYQVLGTGRKPTSRYRCEAWECLLPKSDDYCGGAAGAGTVPAGHDPPGPAVEFVAVEPSCVLPVVVFDGALGLVVLGGGAGLVVFGAVDPELLVLVFGVVALALGDPVWVVLFAGTHVIAPPLAGMPVCGFVPGVVPF